MAKLPLKDQILHRVEQLLWLHFPDDKVPNGPSWRQEPYRYDFFKTFLDSNGSVTRDELRKFVRTIWHVQRQYLLPTIEDRELDSLVDAWGEWEYAKSKLQ